ncbi:AP-like endonuclease reverse transcriptase [Brachionus plicatilis]|uniref:AP-like endonuclease reverse transcriptase n=1 Tax=Brachionus plicatilis TaxID=10195 RepID=A0A3M7QVB8_BRAPC|nr:AP-like endonuclease reverse transcriptase [Brachionus plicatilis]
MLKSYVKLFNEIKRCKPNSKILNAYINSKEQLIIKTESEEDLDYINRPWDSRAFEHGVSKLQVESKFYLAIYDVKTTFDVNDKENKKFMSDQYNISNMLRINQLTMTLLTYLNWFKIFLAQFVQKTSSKNFQMILQTLHLTMKCKMTTNSLKILHINIHSSNSDTKILQLTRLIQIFKIDIISINETFLKPNDPFSLPGFTIVRDDRLQSRGGGTALCIKDSIEFHEIPRLCSATHENIVGVNITIGKNEKLAIFTIYSSPSTVLNDETLHFINSHFPKFIIVGDLNSKSKTWHFIKENTNGEILENFINASNCHVLNCEKPTFPRGNSIIDLTICSPNMDDFFHSHKVLADKISDHQPTITSFKNLIPRKKLFTINKIDWAKFDQILKVKKGAHALDPPLNIDTEADKIIADILDAINKTTKLCNFTTTATHPIPIPENLETLSSRQKM